MKFGQRLKELRERRGYTQEQLAERLHMQPANVSSYERNRSVPPSNVLAQIADIFDVSADYLLGRDMVSHEISLAREPKTMFGSRLKELRLKCNLTQIDMANKLKMGRSNYGHIENDRVVPSIYDLEKLADILGTSTDYLLGRHAPNAEINIIEANRLQKMLDRIKQIVLEDARV